MEEKVPSNASAKPSLAEIDLPTGEGPIAHAVKFLDPRDVEAHFKALRKHPKSAEERWAAKTNALPFREWGLRRKPQRPDQQEQAQENEATPDHS